MSATSATTSRSSRASTPITEDSRAPSPDFRLPPDTPEMIARRETTDRASAEIGRRLLQGWAMLGDECQNESCYGTPLMRPPPTSAGAGKNPRKECVVCGSVYISERSAAATQPAPVLPPELVQPPAIPVDKTTKRETAPVSIEHPETALNSTIPALRTTTESLSIALTRMAEHMTSLSAVGLSLDVRAIGETADAIAKVAEALGKVHALEK